ncbi:MAG: hypothetical protein ABL958_21220, partial [Bdellovibrionia bacterium]
MQEKTPETRTYGLNTLIGWIVAFAVVFFLNVFGFENFIPPYPMQILMYIGINIILSVSLNLVNGFTGQFSMGHAGFMAVGGYVSAACAMFVFPQVEGSFGSGINLGFAYLDFSIPYHTPFFILSTIMGGLAAAFAGVLVGLPSLRLK